MVKVRDVHLAPRSSSSAMVDFDEDFSKIHLGLYSIRVFLRTHHVPVEW